MKKENTNTTETTLENDSFLDEKKLLIDLEGLASLSKETKKSAAFITDNQIRMIIDNYYQTQRFRISVANQVRAVSQEFDEVPEGETPAIAWLLKDIQNRENQIKKMIDEYAKTVPVCQWAMAIKGIGPVFAANLWSYIDMNVCKHANQFLSYAGLNDNNCPWLGKEKANKIVNEAYDHFKLKNNAPMNYDVLYRISENTGRSFETVCRGFNNRKEKSEKNLTDKTILTRYLSIPPYNIELKKVAYLIGESFCKVSNRGSLYGRIYQERKAAETAKNENLEYKDQADKLLSEKNYSTNTDTYKFLSEGKLSPAHINQRAKRYAVKIFLTHFFEACWIYTHHTNPPEIYPIAHQGHVDYIPPEVPYEEFFTWEH